LLILGTLDECVARRIARMPLTPPFSMSLIRREQFYSRGL
jgi:hypothetical protein